LKKESFKHNHTNRKRADDVGTKTCFVTKEVCPRAEMLRFVISPDKAVVFDVAEKLPGHGMWLRADASLLEQAMDKHIFYKAAHGTVKIPTDLDKQVESSLSRQCRNLLGLCRKAGLLIFGYEAVKKAVAQRETIAVFEAVDASERGQSKVLRPDDSFPIYSVLNRSELGQVAGLDEVVHVALLPGKLSDETMGIAHKIALFKGLKQKG